MVQTCSPKRLRDFKDFLWSGPAPSHLHEDLPDNDIVVVFEHGAEHHGHSVFFGFYIPEAPIKNLSKQELVQQTQLHFRTKSEHFLQSSSKHELTPQSSGGNILGSRNGDAPADVHGLVVSVVHHSPLLAVFALFLELEVLLEHRGEAVPLQHPRLVDHVFFVGR